MLPFLPLPSNLSLSLLPHPSLFLPLLQQRSLSCASIWVTSKYGFHHSAEISAEMRWERGGSFRYLPAFALSQFRSVFCDVVTNQNLTNRKGRTGEECFYTTLLKCKIGSNIIIQTQQINLLRLPDVKSALISFDLLSLKKQA